jgi:hypothetical protein
MTADPICAVFVAAGGIAGPRIFLMFLEKADSIIDLATVHAKSLLEKDIGGFFGHKGRPGFPGP